MDRRLIRILEEHEKEDHYRICCAYEDSVMEEFSDPLRVFRVSLNGQVKDADEYLELSYVNRKLFRRTAAAFSIRKHTKSIQPYFHYHDFWELIYVSQGKCVQKIGAMDNEVVLGENEMCLLHPDTAHAIMPCGDDDIILKLIIPLGFMRYALDGAGFDGHYLKSLIDDPWTEKEQQCSYILFQPGNKAMVDQLMKAVLYEDFVKEIHYTEAVKSYLMLLFIEMFRDEDYHKHYQGDMVHEEGDTQQIVAYIHEHYDSVTLEGLAELFHYNPKYLSRMIREYSGKSFSEMVKERRLGKAVELIKYSKMPVDEIAEKLGYKKSASLYRLIKEAYGLTPLQLRGE